MNPLREMIINEIIQPEVFKSTQIYLGTIESCNSSSNTADVRLGIDGGELYSNVPFSSNSSNVHGSNPKTGTPVIVSFLNGDMAYPYIVSILKGDITDILTGKNTMVVDYTTTPVKAPIKKGRGYYGGHSAM